MADLGLPGGVGMVPIGKGLFSKLARIQYAALARMRWQSFMTGLRSMRGLLDLGAAGVTFLVYCILGISLGVVAGVVAFALVERAEWHYLAVEFWALCIVWQAIAIALASFQEQYDLSGLLRFPVSFGSFVLLHLVFGLLDVSTIIGGLCCFGVLLGIALARPHLLNWVMVVLATYSAFNILLVRVVLAWIDRWLAKRRSREIISALFLLAMLSLQLLNPALRSVGDDESERHREPASAAAQEPEGDAHPVRSAAGRAQAWLPPGLAAAAMQRVDKHDEASAVGSLGVLGAYVLCAGGLLTLRLRSEYRGESLGEAPSREVAKARDKAWLVAGGPVGAVFEKELRTLTRSMPQIYAVAVPMLMVFIISNVFHSGISESRRPFQLAFPVCVAYGLLGFIQLIYNNLGGEGRGIQLLFLSPTPIRAVLLGKNLLHASLFAVVAMISGLLASARLGAPGVAVASMTIAWLAFALPANLAAGNLMSLTMPYRVNLGRLGRQAGSQANALLSMLIQATILGIGAGVVSICTVLDRPWLAVAVLAMLACGASIAWMKVLGQADAMANARREELIGRLAKLP
jgi:ABC-2 type transport system permease protein